MQLYPRAAVTFNLDSPPADLNKLAQVGHLSAHRPFRQQGLHRVLVLAPRLVPVHGHQVHVGVVDPEGL